MNPTITQPQSQRQRGQTIIIAMVVLGVLLILGFVFIGIVDRNGKTTFNLGNRSVAYDLAQGGIRYAHQQLLQSELGADWRGTPTSLGTGNGTLDPDAYYLRPAATLADGVTPLTVTPGGTQIDLGGPDGLGPFFRINNANGRSLVRVRYAPSDANIFSNSPVGPLRRPGLARDYIIIEAIGREGQINVNDPTTLSTGYPLQFRNFATDLDFRAALGLMKQAESKYPNTQVLRAFASIGIIESARYITNIFNVSRPADIGFPKELGVQYPINSGTFVASNINSQLGGTMPLYNLGNPPTPAGQIEGNGSFYSNANVVVHGNNVLNLNRYMGDQFDVAGSITGDSADGQYGYQGGQLTIVSRDVDTNPSSATFGSWLAANTTILNEAGGTLDSMNPNFNTVGGLVRDGAGNPDQAGNVRSLGIKTPPSILVTDPDTNENRYVTMTADSGTLGGNGNNGRYGFGSGIYVYNPSDVQGPVDESGRTNIGSQESLTYDWLNPNNGQAHSGWQGYLYVPPGAILKLLDDGFTIQRDSQAPQGERTWRYIDGSDTGNSLNHFRIGLGSDGLRHIVNSFTPASSATPTTTININGTLQRSDYDKGPVFNGVLYFEGNTRVRGVIPTDVQLTVVSDASIYIEGSITKGITANGLQPTEGYAIGQLLTRPSKSMLMLMAKDYVTVNTTQFLGLSPNQQAEPVNDTPNQIGFNPIRVRTGGSLSLDTEFARDPQGPTANPNNPSTWQTFNMGYSEAGIPAVKLPTNLLIAHTMDDGPAPATFFQLDVNMGGPAPSPYFFLAGGTNTAFNYITGITPTSMIPEYGLGSEVDQRYPKFEETTFPVIDPTTMTTSSDGQQMVANGPTGAYALFAEGTNELTIRQTSISGVATNDYIVGRAALAPNDIRIEAAIYAEQGSFFVIPGPWFNPNPNDRRDYYVSSEDVYAGASTTPEKDAIRLENFGATPGFPFYGEPLDIRIVISGAVSENMPPPASVQAEWLKKWGWIPKDLGATGLVIPGSHVPPASTLANPLIIPNLIINYDPVLATGRSNGYVIDNGPGTLIRTDSYGRPLPPMPRLPVSPTLAFFGEVQ
ncbi:MAG: hypothetical protein P4L46_12985 [Fimbriimonas sp.]|nr:hypothetical protein [Fimbriimonas sp.]